MFGNNPVPLRSWKLVVFAIMSFLLLSPVSAKELLDVPVGVSPVMSSAGIYIAQAKGYFTEQGLAVKLNPFKASGAKMTPFLATGQLFVAGGNVTAGLYNANANDIPIKIVADKGLVSPKHGYLALLVRKDLIESGRYKDYKDLKGMTMAVTAKGVSQEIATELFLHKGKLTLQDIKLVTLAYADMNIAFANKSLDAAVQIEPFVTAALDNNWATRIAGSDEVYPNQQSAVILYSPVFIEKYPEQARAFMVAYIKGVRDYNDAFEKGKNKDDIIRILNDATETKDPDLYRRVVPAGLHPDGKLNVQSLKDDARWFFQHDYFKEMPDVDAIIDESFIDAAIKILGPYQP